MAVVIGLKKVKFECMAPGLEVGKACRFTPRMFDLIIDHILAIKHQSHAIGRVDMKSIISRFGDFQPTVKTPCVLFVAPGDLTQIQMGNGLNYCRV